MTNPRISHLNSAAADLPQTGIRAATYRLLLDTAMEITQQGRIPSIAEIAETARVARVTAYRYFPTKSALVSAIVGASLGPVLDWRAKSEGGLERVRELFTDTFPRFREFEPQMRAAVMLSLEQWALERAGEMVDKPYRRGRRITILSNAIAPLKNELSQVGFERLMKGLSLVYGIESYIVLKDIWGCEDAEVETIALWAAEAMVQAAMNHKSAKLVTQKAGKK